MPKKRFYFTKKVYYLKNKLIFSINKEDLIMYYTMNQNLKIIKFLMINHLMKTILLSNTEEKDLLIIRRFLNIQVKDGQLREAHFRLHQERELIMNNDLIGGRHSMKNKWIQLKILNMNSTPDILKSNQTLQNFKDHIEQGIRGLILIDRNMVITVEVIIDLDSILQKLLKT